MTTTVNRDNIIATALVAALYYFNYTDPNTGKRIDYVFGGEDVTGMDCSGFVQTVFGHAGIKLPRVSADQLRKGTAIPVGQEQVGDLLGFNLNSRNGSGVEHVGICIGNGLMLHTAKVGEGICISDYKKRYGKTFTNVARVF